MVKKIKLEISHDKGEKIEVLYNNKRMPCKLQKNKEASYIYLHLLQQTQPICIRQYHALNSFFWWIFLLIPIAFIQGYLLRYEKLYIDDYYAQINFDFETQQNSTIRLKLVKKTLDSLVGSNFYIDIRKDQYLKPKKRIVQYNFIIVDILGGLVKNICYNKNVSRKFILKWKIVRLFPALITYGAFIVLNKFYLFNDIKNQNIDFNTVILAIFIIALYLIIFKTISKIVFFNVREKGISSKLINKK